MEKESFYETAKSLAVVDVPVAHPENTVKETIERILGRRYTSASHIVVLEEGKLVGIVTAEDLFSANPENRIGHIMDNNPPRVGPETDQEVVAWQAVQRGEYAMPVVDHYGYFLGLIPPYTLLKVLLQEHEEDLSRMAGILGPDSTAVSYSGAPMKKRVVYRLPWLLVGLAGGFFAAGVVGMFEKELEKHVALAFFIPTVVYLADAVGTQTEALVVRAFALGLPADIRKETKTSTAIGFVLFLFSLITILLFWKNFKIAFVVSLAILLASSVAGFIASLLPLFFKRIGLDPAHGSGPLATVIQDIISVFIYFLVASLFL